MCLESKTGSPRFAFDWLGDLTLLFAVRHWVLLMLSLATLGATTARAQTGLSTQWFAQNTPGDSSNNEQEYYLPSQVSVSNGMVQLTAIVQATGGLPYTSGRIVWSTFNFTYGEVEYRAKMAGGTGTWPAVWLLGYQCQPAAANILEASTCNWPEPGSNEIDITEIKNGDFTHPYQNVINPAGNWITCQPTVTDVTQNFHVYDFTWSTSALTWYIDGVQTCQVTDPSYIPSAAMFLIINVAVGGTGGGTVDPSTLPQSSYVDYVRVYSSPSYPPAGTPIFDDEFSPMSIVPNTLFFGTQLLATPSAALTASVTNSTGSAATINSISVAGANSGDFAINPNCPIAPSTLASGGNCTIQVTFTPQAAGPRKSSISISDSSGSSTQTILVTGVGTAISTSASSLSFSSPVGTPSAAKPVMISNEGSKTVSLYQITFVGTDAGDFSQSNTSTCGSTLGAGASCTVEVVFTPGAAGSRAASLMISDNGGGSPQVVALAGTGTSGAAATLSTSALVFSEQAVGTTSSAQTVVLTNRSSVPLVIGLLSTADAGEFFQTNTCGSSLAANASCTIEVRFAPRATGTRTTVMRVSGNGQSLQLNLQGTGIGRKPLPTTEERPEE